MRPRLTILCALLLLPARGGAQEEPALAPAAPVVRITEPNSGWTRRRIVTVRGSVTGVGLPSRVTLVVNGVAQSVELTAGLFESEQVLAPGRNAIVALAENAAGVGRESVSVLARVPRKDLRVTLTWDTTGSDMDLWLTGPDGEKCYFENPESGFGATLDTDVVGGFGPETITVSRCSPGRYTVNVHYFGDHGAGPPLCRIVTVRDEGRSRERRERRSILLRERGEVREVTTFRVEGP
ncbi:MAG: YfaP family protein [Planctomycetota bacterium]|jgi:uncharacterized protein YfaP (DUF2135 family)